MPPPNLKSRIHLVDPAPVTETSNNHTVTYLIYYVTGNPGLIAYYDTFLTHLYGLLTKDLSSSTSSTRTRLHVFGRSLSGFEVDGIPNPNKAPSRESKKPPYSLQEQIEHSKTELEGLVKDVKAKDGVEDVRVILMGHSVGSYILLEIVRRVREQAKSNEESVRIAGGVCLFATVTHISESENGKKATWLLTRPWFAFCASLVVKGVTFLVPVSFLALLIRNVMSFSIEGANVTAAFLKSPMGVYQALYMAGDEMREITADSWDSDIWGAAHASEHPHPRPFLRFLFGKKDHWVADHTRDDLIRARGSTSWEVEEWKPLMEIDETEGWVHAFCIKQSVPVAERVFTYVRDMIAKDLQR